MNEEELLPTEEEIDTPVETEAVVETIPEEITPE